MSYYVLRSPADIERREVRRRAVEQARLTRNPGYPLALAAAKDLKKRLGIGDALPSWLNGICGAIDGCGHPYVHVSLSQWSSRGTRFGTEPDGEVPEFPKRISGIPVFVAVTGCFGEKSPGCNGEPCVDTPDPAPSDLGQVDYGEFGRAYERFKAKYSSRPWYAGSRLASRPVFSTGPNVYEVLIRCDPFSRFLKQAAVELSKDNLFEGQFHIVPLCASMSTMLVEEIDLNQIRAGKAKGWIKNVVDNQLGDLGELSCDDEQLPSGRAWVSVVQNGDPAALASALGHTVLRAGLIGTGLWLAGARRDTIVRDSVAGSVGIDAFILAWTLWHK